MAHGVFNIVIWTVMS